MYRKNTLSIIVYYLDGKTVCEEYTFVGEGQFTEKIIQSLLDINSLGSKWDVDNDVEMNSVKVWKLENGAACAVLEGYAFKIMTKEYAKLVADEEAKEMAAKGDNPTQGF